MISKIKLQINLMLELFVFKVGIVRIDLKIWFMSTFFFQICDFKFLPNFLLSTFFFEFAQFFPFFPQ
jgi:hypothetical protein